MKIQLKKKIKENTTQNLWDVAKASKREAYFNTILSQDTKTSNRQLSFTPKQLEKEEQKTYQNYQKKKHHKYPR